MWREKFFVRFVAVCEGEFCHYDFLEWLTAGTSQNPCHTEISTSNDCLEYISCSQASSLTQDVLQKIEEQANDQNTPKRKQHGA